MCACRIASCPSSNVPPYSIVFVASLLESLIIASALSSSQSGTSSSVP
jgi:hypothetical protein